MLRDPLVGELGKIGLREGDTLVIHGSLSAFGRIEGGAERILDALFAAIGPEGTIVGPAFRDDIWSESYGIEELRNAAPQDFCSSNLPGFQGAIPETLRARAGALRSFHPTHSWVAVGAKARQVLKDHGQSPTPCGKGCPAEEAARLDGAIVGLGVGPETFTMMHYPEDVLAVPYLGAYDREMRHITYTPGAKRMMYTFPRLFEEVLLAASVLAVHRVGKAVVRVSRMRRLLSFLAQAYEAAPWWAAVRPEGFSPDFLQWSLAQSKRVLAAWERRDRPAHLWKGLLSKERSQHDPVPFSGQGLKRRCPAWRGEQDELGFCAANGRHPGFRDRGGLFAEYGVANCSVCPWEGPL
ncbi:MAG: AAC(3) family N-acetyltransferase [Planctomycetota bacterium]